MAGPIRSHVPLRASVSLAIETSTLFVSFYLCQMLWRAGVGAAFKPLWWDALWNALVFTLVVTVILTGLGVYERRLWRGPGDVFFRYGVGFLTGLFALSVLRWWLSLDLGRGETLSGFAAAGAGVGLSRWALGRWRGRAAAGRQVVVLGAGRRAAQLTDALDLPAAGVCILGYVPAHPQERSCVPPERRLEAVRDLGELASELHCDELWVAVDDGRQGFSPEALAGGRFAGLTLRSAADCVERETGRVALEAGDRLLLCSDGVHDEIGEEGLRALFDPHADVITQVTRWRDAVWRRGAKDNLSMVLIGF